MNELISKLRSGDETERRYAAEDLAEFKAPEVVDALTEALHDKMRSVAEAAVESLIIIGGEGVCRKVVPLLYSESSSTRNYAIEVLQKVGESDLEVITMLLKDEDKDVRKFAADILGYIAEIGGEDAFLPLVKTLNDDNVNVAAAAAEALGRLGDERAVPFLVKKAEGESWLQCNVIHALCEIGGEKAHSALRGLSERNNLADEGKFMLEQALVHIEGIHDTSDNTGGV